MIIAGIDPGLGGAVALLDAASGQVIDTFDTPTLALTRGGKHKREVDAHSLAGAVGRDRIGHAFVELVGAMPSRGVSSMFAFGKAFGIVIGVVSALGMPTTLVSPRKWKVALGVPASKDGARARASQLMPAAAGEWRLVKHDGPRRGSAAREYGRRELRL